MVCLQIMMLSHADLLINHSCSKPVCYSCAVPVSSRQSEVGASHQLLLTGVGLQSATRLECVPQGATGSGRAPHSPRLSQTCVPLQLGPDVALAGTAGRPRVLAFIGLM